MLLVAGILEGAFAVCLKLSNNFTQPVPTLGFFVFATASFVMLTKAASVLPLGTAYAVWTGIGAAGTVLAGRVLFAEPLSAARLFFLFTLTAAIAGLRMIAPDEPVRPPRPDSLREPARGPEAE